MKSILKRCLGLSLVLLGCACGSSSNATDAGGNGTDGGTTMPPAAPTVGAAIDRMGRAGVNTALTDPFDTNAANEDMMKDMYNHTAKESWSMWKTNFAKSLAIFDALDKMCGNQFAAGSMAVAGRYDALANVLVDDQLYVDTSHSTCTTYLAVEANATNIIPNADCGGRTPLYNTIDVTYSVLAIGMLSGVSNGITSDAEGGANATTFPFLGAPNP
jgi:hypothetical protein